MSTDPTQVATLIAELRAQAESQRTHFDAFGISARMSWLEEAAIYKRAMETADTLERVESERAALAADNASLKARLARVEAEVEEVGQSVTLARRILAVLKDDLQ